MKALNKFFLLLIVVASFSCTDSNFEELSTEARLEGRWLGYQTVDEYSDRDDVVSNFIPTYIAFPYDNGLELWAGGTLYGLAATNPSNPDSDFNRYPGYVDTWELIDDNHLRLAGFDYQIVDLTEYELVIKQQIDSNHNRIVILIRE